MKRKVLAGTSAVLIALGLFLYKLKKREVSLFEKIEILINRQIYKGYNKQEFLTELHEITKDINQQFLSHFAHPKYFGAVCCTQVVSNYSLGYYCLDCQNSQQIDPQEVVWCQQCFNRQSHEGHKFAQISTKEKDISCKCGDSNYIKQQGFCSLHIGLSESDEIEIREKINNAQFNDLAFIWKGVLLLLLSYLETMQKIPLDGQSEGNVISIIDDVLSEIYRLINMNIAYAVLFGDLISSKIYNKQDQIDIKQLLISLCKGDHPDQFQSANAFSQLLLTNKNNSQKLKQRVLLHNCKSTNDFSFLSVGQRLNHHCNCSFIEMFIRCQSQLISSVNARFFKLIFALQGVRSFKQVASVASLKLLSLLDTSKIIQISLSQDEQRSPYLALQKMCYPSSFGCNIVNSGYIINFFVNLSKDLETISVSVRLDIMKEVLLLLSALQRLTSQSEVNTLIILNRKGDLFQSLLKILAKIEKRGLKSLFTQQSSYLLKAQISLYQSVLQTIVYQEIRDVTLLTQQEQQHVIQKLHDNQYIDINALNIKQIYKFTMKQLFTDWLSNFSTVQFDKNTISQISSYQQEYIVFSSLIVLLIYGVSFKKLHGNVENMSRKSVLQILLSYLNNKNRQISQQEQVNKFEQIFIELDNTINNNTYNIFHKSVALDFIKEVNQIFPQHDILNEKQRQLALSILEVQWNNFSNDVLILLRQMAYLFAQNKLIVPQAIRFQQVSQQLQQQQQQQQEINANLNRTNSNSKAINNADLLILCENLLISCLYSGHMQFLKLNFMSSENQISEISQLDEKLRSSLSLQIIQYFHLYKDEVTLSTFKSDYEMYWSVFSSRNLHYQSVLLHFSTFDSNSKVFKLKDEFKLIGSNCTTLISIPQFHHLYQQLQLQQPQLAANSQQDILYVNESFDLYEQTIINDISYQFNYLPSINIVIFTKLIASPQFVTGVTAVQSHPPTHINFLTVIQYIIYFIKAAKETPRAFVDVDVDEVYEEKTIFDHLYNNYIQSRVLVKLISSVQKQQDTQHLHCGMKKLLAMQKLLFLVNFLCKFLQRIKILVEDQEGEEEALQIGEQAISAEQQEQEREDQRKQKLLLAKQKQQELLSKFAAQRNAFETPKEVVEPKEIQQQGEKEEQKEESKIAGQEIEEEDNIEEEEKVKKCKKIVVNEKGEQLSCSICSENIEEREQYGYPIYVKQQKQYENEYLEDYVSMGSCGHYFHNKCWNEYKSNQSVKSERDIYKYRNQSEVPCSLCKVLSNYFYISQHSFEQKSKILNNQEVEVDNLVSSYSIVSSQSLLDNIQDILDEFQSSDNLEGNDKEILQNDKSILSIVDLLLCLSVESEKTEELIVSDIEENCLMRLLIYPLSRLRMVQDIKEYINQSSIVYSHLLQSIISQINQIDKQQVIDNIKEAMKELDLVSLFELNLYSEYCLKSNPIDIQNTLLILFAFLLIPIKSKQVQPAQRPSSPLSPSASGYQEQLNQQPEQLQQLAQQQQTTQQFEQLVQDNYDITKQLFNSYLVFLNFIGVLPTTQINSLPLNSSSDYLSIFSTAIFSNTQTVSSLFQKLHATQIENKSFNQNDSQMMQSLSLMRQTVPKLVTLFMKMPQSFELFKQLTQQCQCTICKANPFTVNSQQKAIKYSSGLSLCLICGMSFCKQICQVELESNQNQRREGNLSLHSLKAHNGQCIFIDLQISTLTYIHYPKNIVSDPIYVSKYGESVNEQALNWQDYELDQLTFNSIQKSLLYNQVPQIMFSIMNGYINNFIPYIETLL